MENKINLSNLSFASPDLGSQKSVGLSQDLNSPKFIRKRTDIHTFFGRRTEKRGEPEQKITFISPKKYLQHQLAGTESYKSYVSSTNFPQNFRPQENVGIQKNCEAVQSSSNMAGVRFNSYKFESGGEICARVRASQEYPDSKMKSQNLEKKIVQLNDKIKCMKEENSYLYKKIDDFNGIILEKNAIINQFSQMLKEKDQTILINHNQIQFIRRKNQELESSVVSLSKLVQQSNRCSSTNISDDTDDGEREKQSWEEEIEKYKIQVQELAAKLKYSEIQGSMYQKLRYDLDNLASKNDLLKTQNKKLIARIQFLSDRQPSQRNSFTHRRNRAQSEVDFELSPQK